MHKKGIAEIRVDNIILNSFMVEIVLNGLSTLKTLIDYNFIIFSPIKIGNKVKKTIVKSKIFQGLLK